MSGYTKLASHLVTSSIWGESNETRIVWITMLALSDKNGEVMASLPGLARVASISVEDVERAIENLSSPDEYSRTKDHEGRRIQQIDGGWIILNYKKHRAMFSAEDRREKNAERQRRFRDKVTPSNGDALRGVTGRDSNVSVTPNRDIAESREQRAESLRRKSTLGEESEEREENGKAPKMKIPPDRGDVIAYAKEIDLTTFDAVEFMDYHTTYDWANGKKGRIRDWKAALRTWKRNKAKYAPKGGKTPHSANLRRTDAKWDDLENQENES